MAVLAETDRPVEGLRHQEPNTTLFVGSNNVGTGTLFLTENVVSWNSTGNPSISLPYRNIILHAISRDMSRFGHECLYLHTDAELPPGLALPPSDDEEDEGMADACPKATELRFVPENVECLSNLFRVMADCQALHPDPQDEISEEEDFEEADELEPQDIADMHISTNGHGDDAMDDDNFQDADD